MEACKETHFPSESLKFNLGWGQANGCISKLLISRFSGGFAFPLWKQQSSGKELLCPQMLDTRSVLVVCKLDISHWAGHRVLPPKPSSPTSLDIIDAVFSKYHAYYGLSPHQWALGVLLNSLVHLVTGSSVLTVFKVSSFLSILDERRWAKILLHAAGLPPTVLTVSFTLQRTFNLTQTCSVVPLLRFLFFCAGDEIQGPRPHVLGRLSTTDLHLTLSDSSHCCLLS